ncbi:MAG: nitroreductase family protein [Rectinemataceae bacterium]
MARDFFEAVSTRRTIYSLGKSSTISDQRLEEILGEAIKHGPSAFNSQSGRIVLLLGKQHDDLWDATRETLRPLVPAPAFPQTEGKLAAFRAGYGTVLFFEDQKIVKELQANYALYKEKFPLWSGNSTGILQFIVWTSLAAEGLGASLQHYDPLIDEWVYKRTGVPESWKLTGEMPFGKPTAPAGPKEFLPLDGRLKVLR